MNFMWSTPRTETQLRAAVRKGITRLNERFPGWRQLLKVRKQQKRYDYTNACRCVLGSIGEVCRAAESSSAAYIREFDVGKRVMGLDVKTDSCSPYGFDWRHSGEIDTLVRLWNEAIRAGRV